VAVLIKSQFELAKVFQSVHQTHFFTL